MIAKNKGIFLEKLKKFNDKKIMVIGDIMLDEYLWGSVERISPEAPVPVVLVDRETRMPGGAANVVNNLIGLGARVFLSGVIGDDSNGKFLQKFFNSRNINTSGIFIDVNRPTTQKTRIIAHNQQVVRVDKENIQKIDSGIIRNMILYIKKTLKDIDGIIISDYGKGVIIPEVINEVIKAANTGKKVIAVDPKIEHFFQYKNVTLITPNHYEASKAMNQSIRNQEDVYRIGKLIMSRLKLRSLFITQSRDGMTIFQRGKAPKHIPTHAKEVYDVTGAGDTVIATSVMGLVSGLDYEQSAALSNFAAGIVVGEVGTTPITIEKLARALNNE
ncbi:MAG: D-glycero-beta-D-manno-heptose-7-phosphate kinase [bacterium]|nr:D-glycero-beta-D-manno-heptose-7-phosphate kinase [bacterium]